MSWVANEWSRKEEASSQLNEHTNWRKCLGWNPYIGKEVSIETFKQIKCIDIAAVAAAKSFQLCLTLCDPTDGSPPGSSVTGILQASMLEWVVVSFCSIDIRICKKSIEKGSVQSLNHVWLFATQASLSITNSWSLSKLTSIESVMPSNHLILCRSLLLPPFPSGGQNIGFSFSISPSNEYSGLISFRMDWLDLLAVQGSLKSRLQHHTQFKSINSSALSLLYGPTLTCIHDHWKNHSFD